MITKLAIVLVLAGCWAAYTADSLTPLDVKLGQWETTSTSTMSGMPPIPQDVLDKMPADQRAKMEERMKAMGGTPRTTTVQSCVKQEDLDKAMTFGADDKSCTRTVVTSSRSKAEIHIECNRNGVKSTGTVRVEAASSDSVKGSMEMNVGDGTRAMKINSTFASKWLGATCSAKN